MMEPQVEFVRPERRFGWAAFVHRQNPLTGKREVLRGVNSEFTKWEEVDLNLEVTPTFYFDDTVMDALVKKWGELSLGTQVSPRADELLSDALSDARWVRDELLDLVKKRIK